MSFANLILSCLGWIYAKKNNEVISLHQLLSPLKAGLSVRPRDLWNHIFYNI